MDGKAAPGLRGTPPDAVVFGSKVSVRARYLHIIIWNGYEIVRKGRSPLGMPQRGMPGRAAHGRNHAGERLACCIVFFPAILWCAPPLLGGDRFSVPHGDCVRHPFGIPGRAGPVLVALRQQAGRAILYHIIFLIMSILYHGKKLRTPSFQCPAYARSAATEWQALVVTRQTVLCTTPFSFGMRKLEKSILWHTVCINRKRGVCSRRSVYAASPRSG